MANRREFLQRLTAAPVVAGTVAGAFAPTPGGARAAILPAQAPSDDWIGGLRTEQDFFLASPPEFEWLREGASFWLFEENGAFAIPRLGIEAQPHTWEDRRHQTSFVGGGLAMRDYGVAALHPTIDAAGRPTILGAGPLSMRCIEPFRRWHVQYEGTPVAREVAAHPAGQQDEGKRVALRFEFELSMATPVWLQDHSPTEFARFGKGQRLDAVSVGLGWRFEQMLRGEGELSVDGETRTASVVGSRVKRRSVRTDALFLRGHCWQTAVFPDGRAFGHMVYPPHDQGYEAWHSGFIYLDGRMYQAKPVQIPWLSGGRNASSDCAFELESELGVTRIEGTAVHSLFAGVWELDLQQAGVQYKWDGQSTYGMLERSAPVWPRRPPRERAVQRG